MIRNSLAISLIAAIGKNRELGRDNKLLFDIPEDMKFFREKTKGHPVIMGRKTYESIGHPLPNRLNIVVTRDANFIIHDSDVKTVHSIEKAIELGKSIELEKYSSSKARSLEGSSHDVQTVDPEIFVIGGAQVYQQAIAYADKLYLTLVDAEVADADAFFPEYSEFDKIVSEESGESGGYKYKFVTLVKS